MDTPSLLMRGLSRRLLEANQIAPDQNVHEAVVVSEKLRIPLTRFAGAEGFASLLRRALVLASEEVPTLQNIRVGSDGRLEGFELLTAEKGTAGTGSEAAVALTAHLLGLLRTFIGESLTLKLVNEAWPDVWLKHNIEETEAD